MLLRCARVPNQIGKAGQGEMTADPQIIVGELRMMLTLVHFLSNNQHTSDFIPDRTLAFNPTFPICFSALVIYIHCFLAGRIIKVKAKL